MKNQKLKKELEQVLWKKDKELNLIKINQLFKKKWIYKQTCIFKIILKNKKKKKKNNKLIKIQKMIKNKYMNKEFRMWKNVFLVCKILAKEKMNLNILFLHKNKTKIFKTSLYFSMKLLSLNNHWSPLNRQIIKIPGFNQNLY